MISISYKTVLCVNILFWRITLSHIVDTKIESFSKRKSLRVINKLGFTRCFSLVFIKTMISMKINQNSWHFFNERKIEKIKKAKKIETSVTKIKLFITTWPFSYGLEICDKDYVKCFYNNKCDSKPLWNTGAHDEGGDSPFPAWILQQEIRRHWQGARWLADAWA